MPKSDRTRHLVPFKKGQSGNPKGKPKGTKNTKTIIREILNSEPLLHELGADNERAKEILETLEDSIGSKISRRHLLIYKQNAEALNGNTQAFNALVDREEGKVSNKTTEENPVDATQKLSDEELDAKIESLMEQINGK